MTNHLAKMLSLAVKPDFLKFNLKIVGVAVILSYILKKRKP